MARVSADSFGCWAAREISQADVPIRPMSAADGAGAEQARPEQSAGRPGRAMPRVRRERRLLVPGSSRAGTGHGCSRPDGLQRTTRSASASKDGRWATMITVRPTISSRTAARTSASVSPSRLAVGSSSSRSGRVAHEGPGQRDPLALARGQSGALGRRAGCPGPWAAGARPRSRPAAVDGGRAPRSSVASGRPRRTLSAMERAKRCGRCGTQATWARQASRSRSARSTSPMRTEPASRVTRPSRTLEQGRLAASARPGEGHDLAGLDAQSWTSRSAGSRRPG